MFTNLPKTQSPPAFFRRVCVWHLFMASTFSPAHQYPKWIMRDDANGVIWYFLLCHDKRKYKSVLLHKSGELVKHGESVPSFILTSAFGGQGPERTKESVKVDDSTLRAVEKCSPGNSREISARSSRFTHSDFLVHFSNAFRGIMLSTHLEVIGFYFEAKLIWPCQGE